MNKLSAEKCREMLTHFKSLKIQGHLLEEGKQILQALEVALPVLEQQGGWISCSGRIPEPLDWVIAYDEVGTVKAYICQHTGEWIRDNGDELYQVTHWQPLPSPPQSTTDTYRQIENDEDRGDDEAFWDADYD